MGQQDFMDATMPSMDMVLNLARRLVRRAADAEDLVQETYARAYQAWERGQRPRVMGAWLATICLNLSRSQYRSAARRPAEVPDTDLGERVVAPSDTETEAIARVEATAVRDALWTLPEEQRIAVTLVDLCGFSTAQAARTMGTPKGTVLSRVHRGRKALARTLGHVEAREGSR